MKKVKKGMLPIAVIIFCCLFFKMMPLLVVEAADVEEFVFEVTVTETDREFRIPTTGIVGGENKNYSWVIDWGDGTTAVYTQANSLNKRGTDGILYEYTSAGTYQIVIKPNDSEEAWLGSFGFANSTGLADNPDNKAKVTKVISPLTVKMTRTREQINSENAPAPNFEWYNTFSGCVNITMGDEFDLPDNITSVGKNFASCMFQGASGDGFKIGESFHLPSNITSVGDDFASNMFTGCSGLAFTMGESFQLPQGITSVGDNFASGMFSGCSGSAFTMGENFQLPQDITSVGKSFASGMFYECSGKEFTMKEGFNLPQNITEVGDSFAAKMFLGCSGEEFTMNESFNLPQGIKDVPANFGASMFAECSGKEFTMNESFNLPQSIVTVKDYFASSMFYKCSGARFTMNESFNFPKSISYGAYNFADKMFAGCSGEAFLINSKFKFPKIDIQEGTFSNIFKDVNALQYRTAYSIINENEITDLQLDSFTDAFPGISYIDTKWGGDGKVRPDYDVAAYLSNETFPYTRQGGTESSAIVVYVINIGSKAITNISAEPATNEKFEMIGSISPTTISTDEMAKIRVSTKDGLAIGTYTDTLRIKCSEKEVLKEVLLQQSVDTYIPKMRKEQSPLTITGVEQILSFGKEVTLKVTGGSGSGKISYEITKGDEFVSLDKETGKLIATGIGTVEIMATKAGDDEYKPAIVMVTFKITMPNKNADITVGEVKYKVTSTTNKKETLTYKGTTNKNATKVTIPATIKIGTKTYKVTKVANNAFKNCKKLKSVTIGKNVTVIGDNAFSGCTLLTKITIPANVKTIGTKAFYNASKLKNITVKSKVLAKIGKNAWKGIHKKATIKVPSSKLKAYKKLFKGKGQAKSVAIKK